MSPYSLFLSPALYSTTAPSPSISSPPALSHLCRPALLNTCELSHAPENNGLSGSYLGPYIGPYVVSHIRPHLGSYLGPYIGPYIGPYLGPYLGQSCHTFVDQHTSEYTQTESCSQTNRKSGLTLTHYESHRFPIHRSTHFR